MEIVVEASMFCSASLYQNSVEDAMRDHDVASPSFVIDISVFLANRFPNVYFVAAVDAAQFWAGAVVAYYRIRKNNRIVEIFALVNGRTDVPGFSAYQANGIGQSIPLPSVIPGVRCNHSQLCNSDRYHGHVRTAINRTASQSADLAKEISIGCGSVFTDTYFFVTVDAASSFAPAAVADYLYETGDRHVRVFALLNGRSGVPGLVNEAIRAEILGCLRRTYNDQVPAFSVSLQFGLQFISGRDFIINAQFALASGDTDMALAHCVHAPPNNPSAHTLYRNNQQIVMDILRTAFGPMPSHTPHHTPTRNRYPPLQRSQIGTWENNGVLLRCIRSEPYLNGNNIAYQVTNVSNSYRTAHFFYESNGNLRTSLGTVGVAAGDSEQITFFCSGNATAHINVT